MTLGRRGRDDEAQDVEPIDEELAQMLARARELPREARPERDLWPQLARRIANVRERESRSGSMANHGAEAGMGRLLAALRQLATAPVPSWATAVSAALILVVSTVFATLWWSGQFVTPVSPQLNAQSATQPAPAARKPHSDADARRIADSLRGRDGVAGVHRSLLQILAQRRDELPPQTVAALEENLVIIDHAIAEIHRALETRADSHVLNLLLAETYRREAELLKQLEWWMPVHEEKSS